MGTSEIKAQLNNLEERRSSLTAELAAAQSRAKTATDGLIEGGVTAGAVVEAQNSVLALERALTDINSRAEGLRTELAEAQAREDREAKITTLLEIAEASSSIEAEYWAARESLAREIEARMHKLLDLRSRLREYRTQFVSIGNSVTDSAFTSVLILSLPFARLEALEAILKQFLAELERRGANLDAVLRTDFASELGEAGYSGAKTGADRRLPLPDAGPFGAAVDDLIFHASGGQRGANLISHDRALSASN